MNRLEEFVINKFDFTDLRPEITEEIYFRGNDTDFTDLINKINCTFTHKQKDLIKLLDYVKEALYIPNVRYINIVESTILKNRYLIKLTNLNCQKDKSINLLYNPLLFKEKESYLLKLYCIFNDKSLKLRLGAKLTNFFDYLVIFNCMFYSALCKYKEVGYQNILNHPYKFIAKVIFSGIGYSFIGNVLSTLYPPYSYIVFISVLTPINYNLVKKYLKM